MKFDLKEKFNMICTCGGIFEFLRVEEYPSILSAQERLVYNRVCDVICMKCNQVLFNQPMILENR